MKDWYKSKTMWVMASCLVAALAQLFGVTPETMPEWAPAFSAVLTALLAILLRKVTNTPIRF